MNLSFKLGIAYEKASQGQKVTEFNTLVDEYNAWIQLHFGGDESLLKSKINESPTVIVSSTAENQYSTQPFNASSGLSKFGKQRVYAANSQNDMIEEVISQQKSSNF